MFIALWFCSVFGMQCCGLWQRKGDNAQTSVQEQSDTLKLHQRHNRHWPWSKRVIGDGQREIFQTDRWAVCSTVPDTNPPAEVKLWRNWCRGKFPQNIRFTHAQTLTEHGEMQKERKKKDVLWAKWEACSNLCSRGYSPIKHTKNSNCSCLGQKIQYIWAWLGHSKAEMMPKHQGHSSMPPIVSAYCARNSQRLTGICLVTWTL